MNKIYKLFKSEEFSTKLKKLALQNRQILNMVRKCLHQMEEDPYSPGLITHKAQTVQHGTSMSSRVSNDLRIIWRFEGEKTILLLLSIGGHEGRDKV